MILKNKSREITHLKLGSAKKIREGDILVVKVRYRKVRFP
jgi:hypothetical protein